MRSLLEDRERKRGEYWTNPEKHKARTLHWRHTNTEKYMWSPAKSRAKKKGFEFTITPSHIQIPLLCPVFNTSFNNEKGSGVKDNSPSLDRIDATQGYTPDNIRVVSWRANNLISNGSLKEFEQIVRFLRGS